jgi:polysaccharide biosynthesis protein PslH
LAAEDASLDSTDRVLYLAMHDPRIPLSGANVRIEHFLGTLGASFHIDLLHLEGSGQPPPPDASEHFVARPLPLASRTGVPFRQRDYFLFSGELYALAVEHLRAGNYRWLVCDYGLAGLYGAMLGRRFGLPVVYSSHNLEFRLYRTKAREDWRRWPLIPYIWLAEQIGARASSIVVAITETEAEVFRRWTAADKVMTIPQGFDPDTFNPYYPRPQNPHRIVLFCGNFGIGHNRRGVQAVIEQVLPQVVERFPDTVFRFVGAHPPGDLHHPNAAYAGFLDDYATALKQADVVISPVLSGAGFPTKIVEALACGKPVVATPVGARGVAAGFRGLHVCPIEDFAEQIVTLLEEDEPVDGSDFERVRDTYEWSRVLAPLVRRMREERVA